MKSSLGQNPFARILTRSENMRAALDLAQKAARTNASILILGETGTGKDLLASSIHAASDRAGFPYVTVNCGAIPESLIESELFGYRKGAFTDAREDRVGKVEAANGGTVFLDEVGDLSMPAQSKLLRAVENHEVQRLGEVKVRKIDVRFVSATNRNLKDAIRERLFRDDLFWRLSEVVIRLPPLRDRREDIPLLCDFFVAELNQELQKNVRGVSNTALAFLMRHDFPGNVRELKNLIRQGMILLERDVVWLEDLPIDVRVFQEEPVARFPTLSDMEKEHVAKALAVCGGNKSKAAKLLGISRGTLYEKIREYKL